MMHHYPGCDDPPTRARRARRAAAVAEGEPKAHYCINAGAGKKQTEENED